MTTFTKAHLVAEADSEIKMRDRVYRNMVYQGKMKRPQMDYKIAAMRAIRRVLMDLPPEFSIKEPPEEGQKQ
jgi:hypothetical protein